LEYTSLNANTDGTCSFILVSPDLRGSPATIVILGTPFCTSLPFHRRLLFDEIWMGAVVLLPIPTVVAAVKAAALRFRTADE
jgi:hypothetical protein